MLKQKQLLNFIFLIICSFLFTSVSATNNPPPTIVKTNWQNPMSSSGCIVLDNQGNLVFKMIFQTAVQDLSTYPPVQLVYDFSWAGGSESGITPIITASMLTPLGTTGTLGIEIYQAEWWFTFNFDPECDADPHALIEFEKYIEMVTPVMGSYMTYPYWNYIGENDPWVRKIFLPNHDPMLPFEPAIWSATKSLCCTDPTPSGLLEATHINENIKETEITTSFNSSNSPELITPFEREKHNSDFSIYEAYPNPFTDGFTVTLNSASEQTVHFNLLNINGKLIDRKSIITEIGKTTFDYQNLNDLPKGMYFLQFSDGYHTETRKIVKK